MSIVSVKIQVIAKIYAVMTRSFFSSSSHDLAFFFFRSHDSQFVVFLRQKKLS